MTPKNKNLDGNGADKAGKRWSAPKCVLIHTSNTAGKTASVGEGISGTTNFCKINPSSLPCLNLGPS